MIVLLLAGCGLSQLSKSGDDTAAAGSCGDDVEVFEEYVWEPVLSTQCAACHIDGGMAAGTALVLDKSDMLGNLQAVSAVIDRIAEKPTDTHPDGHGGGLIISEGSAEHGALLFWRGWVEEGECALPEAETCAPLGRRARRLSHAEYARSVADLLEMDDLDVVSRLPADTEVEGFDNDAEALVVSSLLADQYRSLAEELSEAADLDRLLPCEARDAGASNCAQAFIEAFGTRTFRRPIRAEELERYMGLFTEAATDGGFDEGIRWVIAAMLQSPHFLYRSELGAQDDSGRFVLTAWEQATELSYLLWGTTPDDALLEDAEDGTLELDDQIARLSADPRAHALAADVVSVWLQLDRLQTVSREGLTDTLRESMAEEVRVLVETIAAEGGTLSELMLAQETWIADSELAALYGQSDTGWVGIDGEGGLMTRAAVLTTHGLSEGSGPVQRGVAVRERLLCDPLPPPPPSLETSPPPVDPDASTRERYAQHSDDPLCSGCHDKIDPLGFAFEHYDQLGAWRDLDGVHEIDASGELDGAGFDGVSELVDVMLDGAQLRACHVEVWRRWATGAEACGEDLGEIGLMAPLADIIGAEDFSTRYGDPSEGDTLAGGTRLTLDALPDDAFDSDIELTVEVSNSWTSGYCADVGVVNNGDEALAWEAEAEIDGIIYSIWSAEHEQDGSVVVFSGVSWNATLEPGEETSFGFCADL